MFSPADRLLPKPADFMRILGGPKRWSIGSILHFLKELWKNKCRKEVSHHKPRKRHILIKLYSRRSDGGLHRKTEVRCRCIKLRIGSCFKVWRMDRLVSQEVAISESKSFCKPLLFFGKFSGDEDDGDHGCKDNDDDTSHFQWF